MRWLLEFWRTEQPPPLRALPRLVLKAALFGGLVIALLSIVVVLATTSPRGMIWRYLPWLLWYSMTMGAIFGTSFYLTCGLPFAYLRPILRDCPVSIARTITVLAGAVGGGMGFALAYWGVSHLKGLHLAGQERIGVFVAIDALIGAILALVIGAFVRLKEHVKEAQAQALKHELQGRAMAESAAKAQASALQAQINPHFFFNALNTVSALIHIDPRAAQEMLGRLGDMFRYTMSCSQRSLVTLDDELRFVENYLALEQARFTDRLQVELPHGDFGDLYLPGLSLQPVVENAVRHGIARSVGGGTLQVTVERNRVEYLVTVRNLHDSMDGRLNLDGFFREGHALANVRERLRLFAGERGGIEIREPAPGWIAVTLRLPVEPT